MTDEQLPGVSKKGRIEIAESDLPRADDHRSTQLPPPAGMQAPAPSVPASVPPPALSAQAKPAVYGSYCGGCGSPIHEQAVVCPRCGVPTMGAAQATGAAVSVALNAKSTGLAILLSLFFTGAGHWYVGRVGRGFAFFAAAFISGILILAVVGLIALPIVWVWAAIDANKCAQEYNTRLLAQAGMAAAPLTLNG